MTRILGIDPGSRITGFGIIDVEGNHSVYVDSGFIRIKPDSLPERLGFIFSQVNDLVIRCQPDEMAIESVFMNKNADSALKLGQARGAAICAVVKEAISVAEYSPREIKQAVVGKGSADKEQVQHMVKILLNLESKPQVDEADALAIALCHGHMRQTLARIPGVSRARAGRMR